MQSSNEVTLFRKINDIRNALLAWGPAHFREYPWRRTRDPYSILIAEVLLHRTRADQVRPVYERFLEEYPDLASLLHAEPLQVEEYLRSLGLRWRTDLLVEMVRAIGERYGGEIPQSREDLMALPGVGDYITSALLTFGGTSAEPIMDTNTVRVIGRVFGLKLNDSARRKKQFREIMRQIISEGDARDISFAMIDLAALICLPRTPLCEICPLKSVCLYAQSKVWGMPESPIV